MVNSMPARPEEDEDDFGISELIPQYLLLCRRDLEALQAALATGDFEKIKIVGHNLKGSGSAYGFPEVTEWGRLLEQAGKNKDRASAEQGVSSFTQFLAKHSSA
jgi:HPt (histidine-containing phosphotransfer) domain-containing protein